MPSFDSPSPGTPPTTGSALPSLPQDGAARLIQRHGPRLLALARHLLGDPAAAAAALQEAFACTIASCEPDPENPALVERLRKAVVGTAMRRFPEVRHRPRVAIEFLMPAFAPDGHRRTPAAPWREATSRQLLGHAGDALLRRLIDLLPDDYRVVLVLRDLEGLDAATAADVLGIDAETIRARLHLARHALRELVDRATEDRPLAAARA